jgi:hypothetical protein
MYRTAPTGLAEACARYPEVADLVKLAVRMEFAEARWMPPGAPERRRADVAPRSQRWEVK